MLKNHSTEVSRFYLILYMLFERKKCIGKTVGLKPKEKFHDNYLLNYEF